MIPKMSSSDVPLNTPPGTASVLMIKVGFSSDCTSQIKKKKEGEKKGGLHET